MVPLFHRDFGGARKPPLIRFPVLLGPSHNRVVLPWVVGCILVLGALGLVASPVRADGTVTPEELRAWGVRFARVAQEGDQTALTGFFAQGEFAARVFGAEASKATDPELAQRFGRLGLARLQWTVSRSFVHCCNVEVSGDRMTVRLFTVLEPNNLLDVVELVCRRSASGEIVVVDFRSSLAGDRDSWMVRLENLPVVAAASPGKLTAIEQAWLAHHEEFAEIDREIDARRGAPALEAIARLPEELRVSRVVFLRAARAANVLPFLDHRRLFEEWGQFYADDLAMHLVLLQSGWLARSRPTPFAESYRAVVRRIGSDRVLDRFWGEYLSARRHTDLAREVLGRLLEQDPADSETYSRFAELEDNEGNFAGVAAVLRRASLNCPAAGLLRDVRIRWEWRRFRASPEYREWLRTAGKPPE